MRRGMCRLGRSTLGGFLISQGRASAMIATLVVFLVTLSFMIPPVIAGSFSVLRVDHIRTPFYPVREQYPVRVEVANIEGATVAAEDVRLRTWMPTFSDRAHGQINEILGFNRGRTLLQDVPRGTPPGEYWIRVTVSNDDERRVKHRLVWID